MSTIFHYQFVEDHLFVQLSFIHMCYIFDFKLSNISVGVDGTTNFAHGYPSFAVSVGVLFQGNPAAAAVVIITSIFFIWYFLNFAYKTGWHCRFYFQVEFVGGPMCWDTRIFSATAGVNILNFSYYFSVIKKLSFINVIVCSLLLQVEGHFVMDKKFIQVKLIRWVISCKMKTVKHNWLPNL